MRAQARADLGVSAACLLAALGTEQQETDSELARAYVGAVLIAEGLHDIRAQRQMVQALIEALARAKK